MKMHTVDITDSNIQKIGQLFPNCITERIGEDGQVETALDFDMLRQELSKEIVEGPQERYQFTWPDKKKAIRLANAPSTMTLRPCREDSVDFDNTQNLYIEGDNLEVLKLLREDYLGKVKMIYIDPPYNTGNDFVYEDDFSQSTEEYNKINGQRDSEGNRLFQNSESNGRFHTDWLNMLYPRLKVARDFLEEDGVIFISIDENEVENLRKICDEIFGEKNYVSTISWQKVYSPKNNNAGISSEVEYLVCYSKSKDWVAGKLERTDEMNSIYKNPDNDPCGDWTSSDATAPGAVTHQGMVYAIQNPFTGNMIYPTRGCCWRKFQDDLLTIMNGWASYKLEDIKDNEERARVCGIMPSLVRKGVKSIVLNDDLATARKKAEKVMSEGVWPLFYFTGNGKGGIRKKTYLKDMEGRTATNFWPHTEVGHNDEAKKELAALFDGHAPFDTPKPLRLMKRMIKIASNRDSVILDFFSGSATMGQAVMEANAEDKGTRKFILIQLPESSDFPNYETLCAIGEDRIRRAGIKLKEKMEESKTDNLFAQIDNQNHLDTGFRVLKLDSSNMNDVYYRPEESSESTLFEDNVKPDRTPEDLLFQVMLECNLPLSAKIQTEYFAGKEVFTVNDGYLIACFDSDVNEDVIKAVAKRQPYYFVMRDSSLSSDNVADNFEQIFQAYSKETIRRIL